jgi:hypothetical protein
MQSKGEGEETIVVDPYISRTGFKISRVEHKMRNFGAKFDTSFRLIVVLVCRNLSNFELSLGEKCGKQVEKYRWLGGRRCLFTSEFPDKRWLIPLAREKLLPSLSSILTHCASCN